MEWGQISIIYKRSEFLCVFMNFYSFIHSYLFYPLIFFSSVFFLCVKHVSSWIELQAHTSENWEENLSTCISHFKKFSFVLLRNRTKEQEKNGKEVWLRKYKFYMMQICNSFVKKLDKYGTVFDNYYYFKIYENLNNKLLGFIE